MLKIITQDSVHCAHFQNLVFQCSIFKENLAFISSRAWNTNTEHKLFWNIRLVFHSFTENHGANTCV